MQYVDLFCGAGGMSLGLMNAGMDPILACDASQPALAVYRRNIGPHAVKTDLSNPKSVIRKIAKLGPDLIAGGPPCTEFSPAGKRIEGEQAALMASFGDAILAVRPSWFVMENVPRALSSRAYRRLRRRLRRAEYGITEEILDASLCGAPQRRLRLLCIGRLGAADGFLSEELAGGLAPRPMTLRDCIDAFLGEHLYFHPRYYDKRAVYSIDEPAPTIRGMRCNPAPGYRKHPLDSAEPSDARAPTIEELGLIQGFPRHWVWRGLRKAVSPTQAAKMIGNAVPPPMAEYVGRAILEYEGSLRAAPALAA